MSFIGRANVVCYDCLARRPLWRARRARRATETAELARRARCPTVTVVGGHSDDVAGGVPAGIRSLELDLDQQYAL